MYLSSSETCSHDGEWRSLSLIVVELDDCSLVSRGRRRTERVKQRCDVCRMTVQVDTFYNGRMIGMRDEGRKLHGKGYIRMLREMFDVSKAIGEWKEGKKTGMLQEIVSKQVFYD